MAPSTGTPPAIAVRWHNTASGQTAAITAGRWWRATCSGGQGGSGGVQAGSESLCFPSFGEPAQSAVIGLGSGDELAMGWRRSATRLISAKQVRRPSLLIPCFAETLNKQR